MTEVHPGISTQPQEGAQLFSAVESRFSALEEHFKNHPRRWQLALILVIAVAGSGGFFLPTKDEHWVTSLAAFFAAVVAAIGLVTVTQNRSIRRENTNVHKLNRLERIGLLVAEIDHLGFDSEARAYSQRRLSVTLHAQWERDEKLVLEACERLAKGGGGSEWERLVREANTEIDGALRGFRFS